MRKHLLLLICGSCFFNGCDVQRVLMRQVLAQQVQYFVPPDSGVSRLQKLTDRVYTFHHHFDRTFIVDTDEGLVIVDPFSPVLVETLVQALAEAGIAKPVHTLIYTHYHLDHVRGGAALRPVHVIAHERSPIYWRDFDAHDIVPPTRLINGDVELEVGGVAIKLLYLGLSHTDTLYAVYLPGESVLYAADLVGVRTLLPIGGVALYTPGYLRALDRLEGLSFDVFVPSHFKYGTKKDFSEGADLQRELHRLVRDAVARQAADLPPHLDEPRMLAVFEEVYAPMKARYKDWHGFDAQVLASFIGAYVNDFVGN